MTLLSRPVARRAAQTACLLGAAVLAVYGFTLGFGFVFDDHLQIERNPWLRSPDGLRLFLTRPFWGFNREQGPLGSNYYRPVFGAFDSLLAHIYGLDPTAFHAASVALHLAVCLLVALGASRLMRSPVAALAAGLLFAVHPVHAEAVAWVGGQPDLLAAGFALIAVLAYLAGKDGGKGFWMGPPAYLLACLAKETGVATALVLGIVEATEWRRDGSPRRAVTRLAPYGVVLAAYLALRIHALGSFAPRNYGVTSSAAGAGGYGGALLARYLGFLVAPFPAKVLAVVTVPPLLSLGALAGLAMALAALVGLALTAWRGTGRREIVLPLAFLFAFLLPVLRADAIGGSNFAERYLYLPSVGFAWLVGLLVIRLRRRPVLAVAGILVIAGLGLAAAVRAAIYRDDRALFSAAVRENPGSEIAHNNLGMALYSQGHLEEAEREYREAQRLLPAAVAPLANLAVLEERRGDLPAARRDFEETLRRLPTHAIAAVHLARLSRAAGDRAGAARRLDSLFAAGGESYDALTERAGYWLQEGRADKAVPLLERAVREFPDRREAVEMLRAIQGYRPARPRPGEVAEEITF